jgi:hypothetical protein
MAESREPFDPSKFKTLEEMKAAFPEEAENFEVSLDKDDHEGFIKKSVIKNPDEAHSEALMIQKVEALATDEARQTIADWRAIIQSHIFGGEKYEQTKAKYLSLLEATYSVFTEANGEVTYKDLSSYLKLWRKCVGFIDDAEAALPLESRVVGFDIGAKFNEDSLFNADGNIPEDYKQKFGQLFSAIAPYYNHAGAFFDQSVDDLVKNLPNFEELKVILKYLVKKDCKMHWVTSPRIDLNNSKLGFKNEDSDKWEKITRGSTPDWTLNPHNLSVAKIFMKLFEGAGLNQSEYWDIVDEAGEEYKTEFAAEFRDQK